MSMAFNNARQQYLKTQVETASKEQLVLMLFDGILRFTEQARKAIREKAIEDCHNALMRAEAIVMELIVTVDKEKGGDVAKNLVGLHAYAYNALVQCNLHKDEAKIDEVQNIYRKLRDGWVNAMSSLGLGPQSQPAPEATQPQAPAAAPQAMSSTALPKAPVAPAPQTPKPAQGPGGIGGIMAAARPAAAPVAAQAPAAPQVVAKSTYGMGRTAMLNAYARPAAPQAQAPAAPLPGYQQAATRSIA